MSNDKRDKIAKTVRSLLQMTVENGCSKEEAESAARMAKKMLDEYNLTVDEVMLKANPFDKAKHGHTPDLVGDRMWKMALAISELIGCKHWTVHKGAIPVDTFFGFKHEVEVAGYLLAICDRAMRQEWKRLKADFGLLVPARQHRKIVPFLDGMADELARRFRAMKTPDPIGTGLIILRDQLVKDAMKDFGLGDGTKLKARVSRDFESAYDDGVAAGRRVSLNRGVSGAPSTTYIGKR